MSKIKRERKKKRKKPENMVFRLGDKVRNSLLCNDLSKGMVILG